MKYLIVQDRQSTHGNHAGMKHMCDLLVAKYPDEYKVFVKECLITWKSPRTFMEKYAGVIMVNIHKNIIINTALN